MVEIMVVLVIIGLLAVLGIPAFKHMQETAKEKRFISDLRTFAGAFEAYAAKNGRWPAETAAGVVPTGMAGEFREDTWISRNSLGGLWDWDYKAVTGYTAGISTVEIAVDDAAMTDIDAMIDDGDLTKGSFVKISSGGGVPGQGGVTLGGSGGTSRYLFVLQK